MKYIIPFLIIIAGLVSCEKYPDKGSYENPILKLYGDAYNDVGASIALTSTGYALCGRLEVITRTDNGTGTQFIESSDNDFGVIITDDNGSQLSLLNSDSEGFDEGRAIIALDDGNLASTGVITSESNGIIHTDIFVSKINSSGTMVWQKSVGGQGNQEGNDIIETADGGLLIVGSTDMMNFAVGFGTDNPSGMQNVFIVKLNAQGDSLWSVSYGFEGNDYGVKICEQIGTDGYMIFATTDKSDQGQDLNNLILFGINSVGNSWGFKSFGGAGNETAVDLIALNDSYLMIGAGGSSIDITTSLIAIEVESDIFAPEKFYKSINFSGEEVIINSVALHPDGYFIIAGAKGNLTSANMMFYYMNLSGEEYLPPYYTGGTGSQIANDVIVDYMGNIVAIGTDIIENNSMICLYKFAPPVALF